ncbi:hypothetical protein D9757_007662 [Collybiopsis confluens]|uniref:C2H2-type domain-containing protein n=1 Tax=Collybiopsis confluens TaxID=2823264 RepID=A0A8H5M3G2_9AGAR|nr:hypothetical protein D9757_007662 [Collybiopsis confluens]
MPRAIVLKYLDRSSVECSKCGEILPNAVQLRGHVLAHGFAMPQRSNLKTHYCTHLKDKCNACPDCDFRTCDPGSLTRHRKRIHKYVPRPRRKAQNDKVVRYSPYSLPAARPARSGSDVSSPSSPSVSSMALASADSTPYSTFVLQFDTESSSPPSPPQAEVPRDAQTSVDKLGCDSDSGFGGFHWGPFDYSQLPALMPRSLVPAVESTPSLEMFESFHSSDYSGSFFVQNYHVASSSQIDDIWSQGFAEYGPQFEAELSSYDFGDVIAQASASAADENDTQGVFGWMYEKPDASPYQAVSSITSSPLHNDYSYPATSLSSSSQPFPSSLLDPHVVFLAPSLAKLIANKLRSPPFCQILPMWRTRLKRFVISRGKHLPITTLTCSWIMGKLNIAHHKSYHPYRRDNIEKVRRDEEEAQLKEAKEEGRLLLADSEARIDLLRQKSGSSKRKVDEELLQLASTSTSTSTPVISTSNGHINFFEDLEQNAIATSVRAAKKTASAETEQGVALAPSAKDLNPWYSDTKPKDVVENDDRRKRDTARKSIHDPLTSINHQLASSSKPSSSFKPRFKRPPSPKSFSGNPEVSARLSRESSERERAMALIRRKQKEMRGSETPSTVRGGGDSSEYGDMYNRRDVEEAHRIRDRRWDEDYRSGGWRSGHR